MCTAISRDYIIIVDVNNIRKFIENKSTIGEVSLEFVYRAIDNCITAFAASLPFSTGGKAPTMRCRLYSGWTWSDMSHSPNYLETVRILDHISFRNVLEPICCLYKVHGRLRGTLRFREESIDGFEQKIVDTAMVFDGVKMAAKGFPILVISRDEDMLPILFADAPGGVWIAKSELWQNEEMIDRSRSYRLSFSDGILSIGEWEKL